MACDKDRNIENNIKRDRERDETILSLYLYAFSEKKTPAIISNLSKEAGKVCSLSIGLISL